MYYKVPLRFQKEIILHVLKNTQANLLMDGTSSILGIFGPPGEGKTVMCKQILEDLGVHVEIMSVSEFENKDAGKPVERLKEIYSRTTKKLLSSPNERVALLIDDADTALGNWGEMTQYTVNTQIIIGELMQIASDIRERKVPIIITGNDFSKIYYPLRRSGRMTSFYWNPSNEERIDSVKMIFFWLTLEDCDKYVKRLEEYAKRIGLNRPPISFYAAIKNRIFDDDLWEQIVAERQKSTDVSYVANIIIPSIHNITVNEIIKKSQQELDNIKNSNNSFVEGSEHNGDFKHIYIHKHKHKNSHRIYPKSF